jgi:hypothetical protein
MISYLKLFGPPISEALRELYKIAVDMPEVCIMESAFIKDLPSSLAHDIGGRRMEGLGVEPYYERVGGYFRSQGIEISGERCLNIISDSKHLLGDYDFFFEWLQEPNVDQLFDLVKKIDEALVPVGCKYTITSKK